MNYKPFRVLGFCWPGFLLISGNSVVRKQFSNLLCEFLVKHDPRARFSKSRLFFFLVCYAILKDFSYLFGTKFSGWKFYRWCHDNWRILQWVIIHSTPDTAYVNHFFSHEFIIWFKSIQAKQVPWDFIARSVTAWPPALYWSSLHTLLRTFERLTCSKSSQRQVVCKLLWVFL